MVGKAGNEVIRTMKGRSVLPVIIKCSRQKRVALFMVYVIKACVGVGECRRKRAASAPRGVKQMRPVV